MVGKGYFGIFSTRAYLDRERVKKGKLGRLVGRVRKLSIQDPPITPSLAIVLVVLHIGEGRFSSNMET